MVKRNIIYCIFLVLLFYPVTLGVLYCDDVFNFLDFNVKRSDWFENAIRLANQWFRIGRINILAQFTSSYIDSQIESILDYKIVLFSMNIIATIVCFLYFKAIIPSLNFLLYLFIYAGFVQYRLAFDGYNSFYGYYMILSILIFTTLLFHLRFLISRKRLYFILSIGAFILLLLSGEIGIIVPLVLIFQIFAFSKSKKRDYLLLIPFVVISLIYLVVIYYVKHFCAVPETYQGIQSNFEISKVFSTLCIQMFASLPLSNLYDRGNIPQILIDGIISHYFLLLIFVIANFIVFKEVIKDYKASISIPYKSLLILFSIIVLSAGIISISVKYQNQLYLGLGYLPVMIQNQALAAIFCGIFLNTSNIFKKAILVLFVLINFATYSYNLYEIKKYSNINEPYITLQACLKDGLLNKMKEGNVIYYNYFTGMNFALEPLFNHYSPKNIKSRELINLKTDSISNYEKVFYLHFDTGDTQRITLSSVQKDTLMDKIIYQYKSVSIGNRHLKKGRGIITSSLQRSF